MKRRIYVSGPMRGFPGHNYDKFNKAADSLRAAGWHVINPVELGDIFGTPDEIDASPAMLEALLAADCAAVASCDAICLLPGWERSKGARQELLTALQHGLEIVQEGRGR